MKELNKELVDEIVGYFKKYKTFMNEKSELTNINKQLKSDFVDIHFEDGEAEDRKRIKKEITKYFNTIVEVDSGSEPIPEIKGLRKEHLDFEDGLYSELMKIYSQIMENNSSKESIDDRIEKEIYLELCLKMMVSSDMVKNIFKLWKDYVDGKDPITLTVVDNYRTLVRAVDALGEE